MATINVDKIIGVVTNDGHPFVEAKEQEFDPLSTSFDSEFSRMFFEQNGAFKIALPAKRAQIGTLAIPDLFRASVVDDPTKGSEKEFTHDKAFLDYFKSYSGPAEATEARQNFLILGSRWIRVSKDRYLPDGDHFFFVEYELEGEPKRIRKKLSSEGDKVLFTREIFTVSDKPVSPEKTSHFHLYQRFIEGGANKKKRLLSAETNDPIEDSDTFAIRIPDLEKLQADLERLTGPLQDLLTQKQHMAESIKAKVPEDAQEALLDQLNAFSKHFDITEKEFIEDLNEYFQETYGGRPDEDDLMEYLSANFSDLLELLSKN